MTFVPEPSPGALAIAALGALVALAWRPRHPVHQLHDLMPPNRETS